MNHTTISLVLFASLVIGIGGCANEPDESDAEGQTATPTFRGEQGEASPQATRGLVCKASMFGQGVSNGASSPPSGVPVTGTATFCAQCCAPYRKVSAQAEAECEQTCLSE